MLKLWALDLKPQQNTFLVTFLNVVFQNDKHLFSRPHYYYQEKIVVFAIIYENSNYLLTFEDFTVPCHKKVYFGLKTCLFVQPYSECST